MNVLSISTMFPSKTEPIFGIFVKRRLNALSKIVNLTVVAPRPYFPLVSLLNRYKDRKDIPHSEKLNDHTDILYPRFLSFPLILKPLDGLFIFITVLTVMLKLKKQGRTFDLIDAHLAFPEGFAAILLGKLFKLPVTITLRGHDVNYLPKYQVRKRQVIYALRKADTVFSVANALRLQAGKLGVNIDKIVVAANGVEADLFYPMDKNAVRKECGLDPEKRYILSIGYLVPRKGFDILIDALHILRKNKRYHDVNLIIIGGRGGEEYIKDKLDEQIAKHGLEEAVRFVGPQKNDQLAKWYNCADIFCLASSLEGWPNVILEALACGVPVIGSNVWGIPEIIGADRKLGQTVERTPQSFADAIREALIEQWDGNYIRSFALTKTWDKTAELIKREMQKILRKAGT